MSSEDWAHKGVIDVLCTTELWKSKPKNDNGLEEVIESYPVRRVGRGDLRNQYRIVLDQYSMTLKKENTTQYVNH